MQISKLFLVYNPIAGRGRAERVARSFSSLFKAKGFEVEVRRSQPEYDRNDPSWDLPDHSVLFCFGGDGTLSGMIPLAVRSRAPIYMVPFGNESLFARGFGMSRDVNTALNALARGTIFEMKVPYVEQLPFTSMVTVGLDAHVVADIASTRTGPIGHIGYVVPSLRAMFGFKPRKITVSVNGQVAVEEKLGYLIVGRTSEYARGLKLVPEASADAPDLAVRFYPFERTLDYTRLLPPLLLGRAVSTRGSELFRGTEVQVASSDGTLAVQSDGDYVGQTPVQIRLTEDKLRVLTVR